MTSMRTKLTSRVAMAIGASLSLPTLFACLDHPLKEVNVDLDISSKKNIELAINKDVDILFVIDNSSSMGEEQGNLAANFPAFIKVLEDPDVKANYRIGITTTDNGHIECRGTRPGTGGQLQLESCLDREEQFISPAGDESRFNTACAANCEYDSSDLEIAETAIDDSPDLKARPWIESIEGVTNLPEDIPASEAFACFGPQGINGCGYEAQLETMYRALGLSLEKEQPSFGFIRDQAILAIVHVTDESDCSYNHKATGSDVVFSKDNNTFWANPDVGPNSSICWNAGVECSDASGGFYEECKSVNKSADDKVLDEKGEDAVLYPLDRYFSFIDAIEDQKKNLNNDQELIVALIGGVGKDGVPAYPVDEGSSHFNQFGIGPGCVGTVSVLDEIDPVTNEIVPGVNNADSYAVPPVRIRDFVKHYDEDGDPSDSMFSVCGDNYAEALNRIADRIREQIQPACYRGCARDTEPLTDWLEPQCVVTQTLKDVSVEIEECKNSEEKQGGLPVKVYDRTDDDSYVMPNDDADACYALRIDPDDLTESDADDLDPICVEQGFNLQFEVQRRQGKAAKPGTVTNANCELSTTVDLDCPFLGY